MAKLFGLVALCVCLSAVSCRVTRETPNTLDELMNSVSKHFNDMKKHVDEMMSNKDGDHGAAIMKVFKEQSDAMVVHGKTLMDEFQKMSINNTEIAHKMEEVKKGITTALDTMKEKMTSPEVTSKAEEVKESFNKGMSAVLDEAQKLMHNKEAQQFSKNIENFTKDLINQAVRAVNTVSEEAQKLVKPN